MAIKLINIKAKTYDDKVVAVLFADTKGEVIHYNNISNLHKDLSSGSLTYTASGDIALLNSFGDWNWIADNQLPNTYTELPYLQSSGTQYIDTGVTGEFSVDTVFSYTGVYAKIVDTILGVENGSSPWLSSYIRMLGSGSNTVQYQCCGTGAYDICTLDTNTHEVVADFYTDIRKCECDGIMKANAVHTGVTTQYSLYLFATNSGGTAKNFSSARIHRTRIYSNKDHTTEIRDLIPCERKSDGVLGYYDVVNSIFYTNSGTGSFIK